jgi:hypothetical protein
MLAVDLLFATSFFACVIVPTPSTHASSVQLVLITFTEAAISNSKNGSATTNALMPSFLSSVEPVLKALLSKPFWSLCTHHWSNLILHRRLLSTGVPSFPALDRRCNFQCTGRFKFHTVGLTGRLIYIAPCPNHRCSLDTLTAILTP